MVAAGDVPRDLQALGLEALLRALEQAGVARERGERAARGRRLVRVPEGAVAIDRRAAVVVVVGDAGVEAGGDARR